jgi:hypothetical protein
MLEFISRDKTLIRRTSEDGLTVVIVEFGDPDFPALVGEKPSPYKAEKSPDPTVVSRASMKCSARQARLALLDAGMLDATQSAVANSDNPAMQISWEYATEWHRTDPMIEAIAAAIGLNAKAIDALFVRAAAL